MNELQAFPITFGIIGVTVLVSILAFNNHDLRSKCMFYPYGMNKPDQYYRFLSHGLIHADFIHLFFNMFTLYSFGRINEVLIFSKPEYIIFYVTALIASSLFDFMRNRNNPNYAALGASGAVSAVLFATIILSPWTSGVSLFGLSFLTIPNIVFAILYLAYCAYMDKRGRDNIGHSAHLWGGLYGFVFTALAKPELFKEFLEKLTHPSF